MIFLKPARMVLLALVSFPCLARAGESALRQDLLRLEGKLITAQASDNTQTPGVQLAQVNSLMARAEASFRAQEYMDVVRSLNEALNAAPRLERYLDAQFYLGRSYEELHYPARAIKAYLRYLSSFASRQDFQHARSLEVIQRLLLLKEQMLAQEGESFDRLLANLVSLTGVPPAHRHEIKLLAAKSAYHSHNGAMAEEWLEDLLKPGSSPHIQLNARFYLALLHLKTGKYDQSEELFLKIVESKDPSHFLIQQLATLNLARLYAARNLPKHAWTWYQKVQGPGESQRMALYESATLLMQSEDFGRAQKLAESYLKSFPNSREAAYLKERMSFLQMSSGSFAAAESSLANRENSLELLHTRLSKAYEGKFILKDGELDELRQAIGAMNIESGLLERAASLNQRLNKARSLVKEHRQEIRTLQLTLGRISDSKIWPGRLAKDTQYQQFIRELAAIGEDLIDHELSFYTWTPAQQLSFVKAKSRRQTILNNPHPRPSEWQKTYQLGLLENRAAKLNSQISQMKAQLAAARFHARKGTPAQQDLASQSESHVKELSRISKRLQLVIEDQRALWLANYKNNSPLPKTRKTFLLLSQEFLESNSRLQEQRDSYSDPATKHIQEDFASNWEIWPRIAGKILALLNGTERQELAWLESLQKNHKTAREQAEQLALKEENLRHAIAKATGKNLPDILYHLRVAVSEQAARGKKWLADVEWQRFLVATSEQSQRQAKQSLDETSIKEQMRDSDIERALHE